LSHLSSAMGNAVIKLTGLSMGIQWACFPWPTTWAPRNSTTSPELSPTSPCWDSPPSGLFPPVGLRGWAPVCMAGLWTLRLGCFLGYRGLRSGDRRFNRIKPPGPCRRVALGNLAPTLTALACMSAAGAAAARRPVCLREQLGWALFCFGLTIEAVARLAEAGLQVRPGQRQALHLQRAVGSQPAPELLWRAVPVGGPRRLRLRKLQPAAALGEPGRAGAELLPGCSCPACRCWRPARKRWGSDPPTR
uniref:Transmembrane protein 150B n=1 Tax=Macrostomum lignano TaxID=282301 RepID=A0A1I8F3Q7_9PLAT